MRHSSISKAVITRLTTLRLPVQAASIRVNPLLALTIALAFLVVFTAPGSVQAQFADDLNITTDENVAVGGFAPKVLVESKVGR